MIKESTLGSPIKNGHRPLWFDDVIMTSCDPMTSPIRIRNGFNGVILIKQDTRKMWMNKHKKRKMDK